MGAYNNTKLPKVGKLGNVVMFIMCPYLVNEITNWEHPVLGLLLGMVISLTFWLAYNGAYKNRPAIRQNDDRILTGQSEERHRGGYGGHIGL